MYGILNKQEWERGLVMRSIAICDDDAAERAKTRALLDAYLDGRGMAARVREFTAGKELLFAAEEEPFDVYLLDVVMPEMNGIELGVSLRGTDRTGAIVYLTTSEDFAIDSYAARAFWYLVKPVKPDKLYPVLDMAFDALRYKEEAGVQVRTQDGSVRLLFDEIYYVESVERRLNYVYRGGAAESQADTASFQQKVAPLLADKRFYRCGASLVLNLQHVKAVDRSGVTLDTGEQLEIPRRAAAELRAAWQRYWLEGGGKL